MKKTGNKVINLFEESNIGFQKVVISESLKMKRGGSLLKPELAYESFSRGTTVRDRLIASQEDDMDSKVDSLEMLIEVGLQKNLKTIQ